LDPDSPAILYDINLFYVMAIAGLNEPALNVLTYVAKKQPRNISQFLADPKLASFVCMPDVQPIYASLPIASSQHGVSCPASRKALR
jgi:hypothetical protein